MRARTSIDSKGESVGVLRARRPIALLGAAMGVSAARPTPAHAQTHELRHDVPVDVAVTGTAAALILATELVAKPDLAPAKCRWCDRDASGNDTLNPVDAGTRDALRWQSPRVAARIADVVGFLGVPATSFVTLRASAVDARAEGTTGVDMLLVGEAVMLSGVLNQAVKFSVGRERPFVHALRDEEKAKTPHPTDNNLSFYSGHTSLTFSIAMASGTIASLRGYRLAPLVWASTTTLAATTGYLRIAADKHYLTDVLTGAVLGSAMGVLVPLLFHGRRTESAPAEAPLAAGPAPAMASLGGAF